MVMIVPIFFYIKITGEINKEAINNKGIATFRVEGIFFTVSEIANMHKQST